MADLFQLDSITLDTVEQGINSLIHQLGKQCKLIYEGAKTDCPNCVVDPMTHRSTNNYNGIGPKPFSTGKCPVCHGLGSLPGTGITEETVQLLIDWQPKPWNFVDPNSNTVVPQGLVSTKGFIADMSKIIQAKYIIIDYTNATFESNRFVRWGEPVIQGNIVKGKFFLAFWQRFGS